MGWMFTSVTIAQLVEQGKLSYDDPLSKVMPDLVRDRAQVAPRTRRAREPRVTALAKQRPGRCVGRGPATLRIPCYLIASVEPVTSRLTLR